MKRILKNLQKVVLAITPIITVVSCSNSNVSTFSSLKQELINAYTPWYDSLSKADFAKNENGFNKDAICSSEIQALYLYCNQWGDFWNKPLHEQKQPQDVIKNDFLPNSGFLENTPYQIRGGDYKYIVSALNKVNAPINFSVYHGVEFIENEFFNQLEQANCVSINNDGSYNYEKSIGQTLTSYGFLSTTLDKKFAYPFVGGADWTDNNILKPPFKEPALFIINIKKGTSGVAWVSEPFKLMDVCNSEDQILINKDKKYLIKNWYKDENKTNIFELDLIV